jgi:hypothetical protein
MKNELTINDKPVIMVGCSKIAKKQVLDLFSVKHSFLIRFDYSPKQIDKLKRLCKNYPPKAILIDTKRKVNNVLGIKYNTPSEYIELVY